MHLTNSPTQPLVDWTHLNLTRLILNFNKNANNVLEIQFYLSYAITENNELKSLFIPESNVSRPLPTVSLS